MSTINNTLSNLRAKYKVHSMAALRSIVLSNNRRSKVTVDNGATVEFTASLLTQVMGKEYCIELISALQAELCKL
jgi:hypothetical protein